MNIVQVINVRWYNATAWYALYLGRLLKDAGHGVLMVVQPGTEPERKAREFGLPVLPLDLNGNNPLTLIRSAREAARMLREFQPRIVNCHRGEGFFLWALFKHLGYDFKLVRTRGDQRPPRHDALNRWLHAGVADAVVVTNKAMARHFLTRMKTPERSVWVIPGGVDTTTYRFDPEGRERVRREFGFGPSDVVLGLVGRFDRVKGQKECIEAVAMLRGEMGLSQARLFLIGFDSATRTREVEEWLEASGLAGSARISGRREDIAACLSALDVGVVASLWSETIARAALEIMVTGRPLVSTDVGVMPDLVSRRALVPPGDARALALKLREAVESPSFRESLAAEQRLVISQLTGRDFLTRTLSLYEGLLSA
ncbi:glycosyltransferase family 4 protein [Desulfovibrio sp.]